MILIHGDAHENGVGSEDGEVCTDWNKYGVGGVK